MPADVDARVAEALATINSNTDILQTVVFGPMGFSPVMCGPAKYRLNGAWHFNVATDGDADAGGMRLIRFGFEDRTTADRRRSRVLNACQQPFVHDMDDLLAMARRTQR